MKPLINYHSGACGLEQNDKETLKWYTLATEQGELSVQYNLGIMYWLGEGCKPDKIASINWYKKAAAGGHACALYNLGIIHFNGDGIKRNRSAAKSFFKKACDMRYRLACDMLQKMESNLIGDKILDMFRK